MEESLSKENLHQVKKSENIMALLSLERNISKNKLKKHHVSYSVKHRLPTTLNPRRLVTFSIDTFLVYSL